MVFFICSIYTTIASVAYLSMALGEGKLKEANITRAVDNTFYVQNQIKLPVVFYPRWPAMPQPVVGHAPHALPSRRYCLWFLIYPLILVCVMVCLSTLVENMPSTKQVTARLSRDRSVPTHSLKS
jgi:hypothetical protein